MNDIDHYLENNRLRQVSPDLGKARGLLKRSQKRLNHAQEQTINDKNAFQILENAYESLREIVESLMSAEGYKAADHVAAIAWTANYLDLDQAETNKLHKFRKLRNASRYEAEEIKPQQTEEILEFADEFEVKLRQVLTDKLE